MGRTKAKICVHDQLPKHLHRNGKCPRPFKTTFEEQKPKIIIGSTPKGSKSLQVLMDEANFMASEKISEMSEPKISLEGVISIGEHQRLQTVLGTYILYTLLTLLLLVTYTFGPLEYLELLQIIGVIVFLHFIYWVLVWRKK